MDEHEIYRLLTTLDPGILLVYEGPRAGCPHCARWAAAELPAAA